MDDKIHFVFNMYDVSHDNTVSKQDLTTLLNQIPKEALSDHGHHTLDHFSNQPPHSPLPFEMNRQRSHSGSSTTLSEINGAGRCYTYLLCAPCPSLMSHSIHQPFCTIGLMSVSSS